MSLKQKAVKGLFWSTVENFSAKGIQFVLGIILARILLPEDYGLIGMIMIFLAISAVFIESGFSKALIQKKDRDEKDFSTVFFFNIAISVVFYLILFLTAPLIANFYNQDILISIVRVIGLLIIINSFGVVQRTKFTINIDFKTQTKASTTSIVVSGLIGIYMAYAGYGVWALVFQALSKALINVTILWILSKWMPRDGFHMERFKALFSFGSKLLVAKLLDSIFKNIYLIVIGRFFSVAELGYYTRAKQLNDFPSANLTSILQRVTFPLLSTMQDDTRRLKENYRIIIRMSSMVVFPLMVGLAAAARPLIIVLLTEKWIESVWMLQLLCFTGLLYPLHALNINVLNVIGRSDLTLRLSVLKKLVHIPVIIVGVIYGIKVMLIGMIFSNIIGFFLNSYWTKRLIDFSSWQQLKEVMPSFMISVGVGVLLVLFESICDLSPIMMLIGQTVIGMVFVIVISELLKLEEYVLLKGIISKQLKSLRR